jgi:pSer/pThr/pTyr-binding forkhead associated (FHA) protein
MVKYPIAIGRSSKCEFSFPQDKEVSRIHAVVELRGDHWYLVDQDSTNGSYVNDQRVTVPFPLKDDDLIQIGEQRLHVVSGLSLGLKDASVDNFAGYPHYYVLLKVPMAASQEQIDEAYAALIEIFDPYLHPASEMVQLLRRELEEAYGVLRDPVKRAEYDATIMKKDG